MTINTLSLSTIKQKIINSSSKSSLMIVTKNRSLNDVNDLISMGYTIFGENRVQEAQEKYSNNNSVELHLIGPLQTNKVTAALHLFDVIQTIDRKKLIDSIHKNMQSDIKTKSFFIQVNIGREKQKSGVIIENLNSIYDYSLEKNLYIQGLMCIPPSKKDPRIFFEKMIEIRNNLNPNLLLSMGMSSDYEIALECKTNIVRIGSSIFK